MQPTDKNRSPWPTFCCVAAGVYMATLDSSIVSIALPFIQAEFAVRLATLEWVVTIYLLVITGLLLGFGRLADIVGHRRVFMAGLSGFTVGSALCSVAGSPIALILARGFQGTGAAMLMACAPGIITATFPPDQRGRGLGLVGTVVALGLTSGPPLGGVLLETWGWRSLFMLNIPFGLVGLAVSAKLLPKLKFSDKGETFDYLGAILLTVGIIGLLLGLNRGRVWSFTHPAAWGLVVLATGCIWWFLRTQRIVDKPLLDLTLFHNPSFSASVAAATLSYMSGFFVVLLIPFYLTTVRGLDPWAMGLALTVTPLVMSVAAPVAGSLSDRVGDRKLTVAGLLLRTLSFTLLALSANDTPLAMTLAGLFCLGAGSGLFNPPNSSTIMGCAPPDKLGVAGGVTAVARNLGMALGIAGGSTVFGYLFTRAGGTTLADYAPDQLPGFVSAWQGSMATAAAISVIAILVSLQRSRGDTPKGVR